MAQYSNEHLTIAELSAYIDEELTPAELALCDAHIQSCQPCQAALADLRLTSALLASMPQVAVPRSFALPTNLVLLPETPAVIGSKTVSRVSPATPTFLRRALRPVSTLVALLGILLFLIGAFSAFPHFATSNSAATMSSGSMPRAASAPAKPTPVPTVLLTNTPSLQHLSPEARTPYATVQLTPTPVLTPVITPANHNATQNQDQNQPPTHQLEVPAVVDPGQPAGRMSIGAALLLLGILGAIVARRLNRPSHG